MQFLCSDGQNNLPCALFPWGLFHHLSTHPLSDESGQKGAKGRGLISSLLLSIILEDFAGFLMNLLFIYLKPQAYNTAPCVSAPPSSPSSLPGFCSELCAVLVSALVSCSSSSIFLCSAAVARSAQCPSCYHDLSSKDVAPSCSGHSLLSSSVLSNCFTRDGPCPSNVLSL